MTSTRANRPATTTAVAALGMGAVLLTLTGCSFIQSFEPEQQRHYAASADAPSSAKSDDAAWFMPSWVPDDAEDIDVRLRTKGPGYAIGFDSADGVDTAACTPLQGTFGGPAMTADFLPHDLPTTGLVDCGDGRATAEVGGRWYSWTTEEPLPVSTSDTNETLRTE
ncbi:hypothetical protein DEJ13_13270 [Curtobacterium sp. MCLR17_007]|uniref:hypothetical protein n=1 Tax=Curtobacterium sp. MCLR17_007 TaxID=2175648 RepID=UPI000DA8B54A|nr:hypothetical protein [Curtobacterium sp. MCLR17_007]WIB59409.1 hypothetical protein DEJ13_13270 [Curtobacterium sp. MCLR17_007]